MVGAEGQSEDSVVLRVGRRHSCSHLGANQPFAGLMRCQSVLCARVWKKKCLPSAFWAANCRGWWGGVTTCACVPLWNVSRLTCRLWCQCWLFFFFFFPPFPFFLLLLPSPSPHFFSPSLFAHYATMTEAELSFPPAARARMQLPINAMCSVNSVRHPRVAAPHEQDKQGGLAVFPLGVANLWRANGGLRH